MLARRVSSGMFEVGVGVRRALMLVVESRGGADDSAAIIDAMSSTNSARRRTKVSSIDKLQYCHQDFDRSRSQAGLAQLPAQCLNTSV